MSASGSILYTQTSITGPHCINHDHDNSYTFSRYPEYILDHLLCLPSSEEAKLDKVVQLRYLHYLIQFFKLNFADLRKKGT